MNEVMLLSSEYVGMYMLFVRRFLISYLLLYVILNIVITTLYYNSSVINDNGENYRYSLMHLLLEILLLLPLLLTTLIVYMRTVELELNTLLVYSVVGVVVLIYIGYNILLYLNYKVNLDDNYLKIIGVLKTKTIIDLNSISEVKTVLWFNIIIYNTDKYKIIPKKLKGSSNLIDDLKLKLENINPFVVVN